MIQESMLRELGLMPKVQEPRSKDRAPPCKEPEPTIWKPEHPGEEPPF